MDRIIDTHVHVWDPSVLPYGWLSGDFDRAFLPADIPRRPGDDTAMIFVEAGSDDGLREAQWVAGLDWPERVGHRRERRPVTGRRDRRPPRRGGRR